MNISAKLRLLNNSLNNDFKHGRYNEDIYALQLINKVINEGPFLPVTAMALRPFVLAFLLNEIVINKRQSIIEFGAGMSTVLLARLCKMLQLPTRIVSVEENAEWAKFTEELLAKENLQAYVTVINVPLEARPFRGFSAHWYNEQLLDVALGTSKTFDMVVVDGPTAFNEQIALSRYFALPFLKDKLTSSHVIFLDDANRKGEKQVLEIWQTEFGKKFATYAETLGVYYSGNHFESNPVKYLNIQ